MRSLGAMYRLLRSRRQPRGFGETAVTGNGDENEKITWLFQMRTVRHIELFERVLAFVRKGEGVWSIVSPLKLGFI